MKNALIKSSNCMQTLDNYKENYLSLFSQMMTEVCNQLQTNQQVHVPLSKYMTFYDLTFVLAKDQLIILKCIFQEWFSHYLKEEVMKILVSKNDFLQTFFEAIDQLKSLLKYITILFQNYETKLGSKELYVVESGLIIFNQLIMNHEIVKKRYQDSYMELINNIRLRNSNTDRQILQNLLQIFNYFTLVQQHRMEIVVIEKQIIIRQITNKFPRLPIHSSGTNYDAFLFPLVLETTRKFYQDLSISWLKDGTSQEYVKKATNQFIIEKNLEDNFYIIFSQKDQIHITFVNEILEQRADQIIYNPNDGFQQLLTQIQYTTDLSPILRVYRLYKNNYSCLENLLQEFQIFVQKSITTVFEGQIQVNDNQLQKMSQFQGTHLQQIDNLQIIYEYCMNLIVDCFENSHKFKNHLELSFKEKINQVECILDKLAMYIHINLSQKLKETTNEQDIRRFYKFKNNILALISFLNHKRKLFQKLTDNLKDRIFKGQTRNIGYEDEFFKCLRSAHPEHFPSDLVTVWKDFKFYRSLDEEIRKELEKSKIALGVNFQFTVFTRTNSLIEFNNNLIRNEIRLPQFIKPAVECMQQFYFKKLQTDKKALIWNYGIGSSTLNIKFGPSPAQMIRLIVSNLQLFILMILKSSKSKSIQEILRETGIQYEVDLIQQLQPLIDLNFVIYQQDNQAYSLLKDQTKLKRLLKPNQPFLVMPQKRASSFEDNLMLSKERNIKIQTIIIRLMKTNKEMYYSQILQGVQSSLFGYYDFSVQHILAQIDELINENYIKRDERINNKFIYTPI